jgi:hypothetical protein
MIFQSRKLNPYAEPVEAQKLTVGSVYFFLNYIDTEMFIPTLEPMIFIGTNLESGDRDQVYFQDLDSYRQGMRYPSASSGVEARFSVGSQKEINHVFDYEHALDELMRCSLRRNKIPSSSINER